MNVLYCQTIVKFNIIYVYQIIETLSIYSMFRKINTIVDYGQHIKEYNLQIN